MKIERTINTKYKIVKNVDYIYDNMISGPISSLVFKQNYELDELKRKDMLQTMMVEIFFALTLAQWGKMGRQAAMNIFCILKML